MYAKNAILLKYPITTNLFFRFLNWCFCLFACLFLIFQNIVSLCSSCWPGIHSVNEPDFRDPSSLPPECQDKNMPTTNNFNKRINLVTCNDFKRTFVTEKIWLFILRRDGHGDFFSNNVYIKQG